jgi:hypothetical protein
MWGYLVKKIAIKSIPMAMVMALDGIDVCVQRLGGQATRYQYPVLGTLRQG